MPYKYIGRTTDFKGKTLWQILGNLKDLGVGRIVCRNRFQRYPEACYMKIMKVEAIANPEKPSMDNTRKVIALVERTFRGKKQSNYVQLEGSTYKSDYFLVPKHKENEFCQKGKAPDIRILPSKMEFPPLLKELIIRQKKANGTYKNEEPKMKIHYNHKGFKLYRVAEDGEVATEPEPSIGLGKPVSPELYANIKV